MRNRLKPFTITIRVRPRGGKGRSVLMAIGCLALDQNGAFEHACKRLDARPLLKKRAKIVRIKEERGVSWILPTS